MAAKQLNGGLRAEHLKLAPATNRNLPAEVCHVEGLGNEQLLTARLLEGDHLVQLRAEPDQQLCARPERAPGGGSPGLAPV